jgi:hypothetical protein
MQIITGNTKILWNARSGTGRQVVANNCKLRLVKLRNLDSLFLLLYVQLRLQLFLFGQLMKQLVFGKQEGSATKGTDYYEGDVSHFSFWNCDVSIQNIFLEMTT